MSASNKVCQEVGFEDGTETEVRTLRDPMQWAELGGGPLLRLLYRAMAAHGTIEVAAVIRHLRPVYARAMELTDAADRFELYTAVKRRVETGDAPAHALVPFVLLERDTGIVSIATADLAVIGRFEGGDELQWPRAIASYLQLGMPANRGAVLGGLVTLGDRRVHLELHDVKWALPESELHTAARCGSGLPTMAAFEFWLTWSEELMDRGLGETAVYGVCASALSSLVQGMQAEFFADIERNFGYLHRDGESAPFGVIEKLSVNEVGARSAERLYALEAVERPPKIMSRVLLHYGLEPQAQAGERFVLQ